MAVIRFIDVLAEIAFELLHRRDGNFEAVNKPAAPAKNCGCGRNKSTTVDVYWRGLTLLKFTLVLLLSQSLRKHQMKMNPTRALKVFWIALLIVFSSVASHATTIAGRDWQPQRTWVFVVGVLEWQHRDMFDSFPKENRRDSQLVNFFRQQGVPEEQIVFLRDAQATLRRVRTSFPSFLSRANDGDFLFFYYTGHGYKSDDAKETLFATYDAGDNVDGWATDSVVKDIERNFKGSRALLTADTCYSGNLAVQAQRLGTRVSYASLTSSSSSQQSTGNWTFTEMLLAGFSGKSFADRNGDGEVSLSELAEDIKDDMAFAEGQRSTFVTSPNFPAQMLIAPAERKINSLISRRVEVHSEGDWYKARVIDARGSQYLVHYYGYDDRDDEWVTARQIRNPQPPQYAAGARVEVNWQGKWYPARVLTVDRGVHLIHYVGYDAGWDEWVSANRIRRPASGN